MKKKNMPEPVKIYAARTMDHTFSFHYGLDELLRVFNSANLGGIEVFEVSTKSIGHYILETKPVKVKQRKSK